MARTPDQIIRDREFAAAQAADPDRFTAVDTASAAAPPPPPAPTSGTTGVAPVPWAQTEAGVTFASQQQQEALAIQRANQEALARQQQANALLIQEQEQAFQREQQQRRIAEERRVRAEERERQRQSNIRQLRIERQGAFSQMMQRGDQARAVLFALGYGPENDVFDIRARGLGTSVQELRGAQELRATTEQALNRTLGRGAGITVRGGVAVSGGQGLGAGVTAVTAGRAIDGVTIGREGVRGLGTAIGAARAFVQGGVDVQTLLASAFGVGSLREGEQPGISSERLLELVRQVTPTGVLS